MSLKRLGAGRVLRKRLEKLREKLVADLMNAPFDESAPAAKLTVGELKTVLASIDFTYAELDHLTIQNRRLDSYDAK